MEKLNIKEIRSDIFERLKSKNLIDKDEFGCPQNLFRQGQGALESYIDHTQLKTNADVSKYDQLFQEARDWGVWSVCIPPIWIPYAKEKLSGSSVKICTVVGFPWGYETTEAKVADTRVAIASGAEEVDMVIPVGKLLSGDFESVFLDVKAVAEACGSTLLKVILETSELNDLQIAQASIISAYAGAWFLKTSTGFASAGASTEAVHIMREVAGTQLGVKASGGIRDTETAKKMIVAGADRLGVSASGAILGKNTEVSGNY